MFTVKKLRCEKWSLLKRVFNKRRMAIKIDPSFNN